MRFIVAVDEDIGDSAVYLKGLIEEALAEHGYVADAALLSDDEFWEPASDGFD